LNSSSLESKLKSKGIKLKKEANRKPSEGV